MIAEITSFGNTVLFYILVAICVIVLVVLGWFIRKVNPTGAQIGKSLLYGSVVSVVGNLLIVLPLLYVNSLMLRCNGACPTPIGTFISIAPSSAIVVFFIGLMIFYVKEYFKVR